MSQSQYQYVPGACNIGKVEIGRRQMLGWIGLFGGLALCAIFVVADIKPFWRLTLFLPAMLAAMGFLQAAWRFCAAFGFGGVFNVGPTLGVTEDVEQEEIGRASCRERV